MTDREPMREISHTPTHETGVNAWFRRRLTVVTDGGGHPGGDRADDRDASTERMADVSHTHDDHADASVEIWARGGRNGVSDDE